MEPTQAEVAGVFTKHRLAIVDALKFAVSEAQYGYLKDWYGAALADVLPLAATIAKYDPAVHTEPSGVRHVSSSDSAVSGDNIPG